MPVREVSVRPYRERDATALVRWATSPDELLQWAGSIFTFPLDERQLATYAAGADRHRRLISAIDTGEEAVLGHAELKILPSHNLGKIGRVAVAPDARGQGVATQMLGWLTALAFEGLGLHRLELIVFSFNEPALRCYRRAGFRQELVARRARRSSSGYWDAVHMTMLESDTRRQVHRPLS